MKKRKQITSQLLPDMIDEIMLKLPLKSLLRFKVISKQWCNQITDSVFARAHLLKHGDVSSFIMHFPDPCNPRISIIDMKEVEEANSRGELLRPLTMRLPTILKVRLENCCDGILCASFRTSGRILLWNPITKWTKKINYPLKRKDVSEDLVGFGYDSSIKDYKVVRISPMHIEVMNLKSNVWRRASNVFPGFLIPTSPVHLNGVLYWVIPHTLNIIISFDLKQEKLSTVQKPTKEMMFDWCCLLTSFQGMLCLMRRSFEIEGCEIWVMKEESNWVKVFDVNLMGYDHLMCCIHEGAIFRSYINDHDLIAFDREKGVTYINTSTPPCDTWTIWPKGFEYVGSLISPPS